MLLGPRIHRSAARGMIAVSEAGVPGIVTRDAKVDGLYRGISLLDGTDWVSGVPVFVGRFDAFLEDVKSFAEWCAAAGAEVRIR